MDIDMRRDRILLRIAEIAPEVREALADERIGALTDELNIADQRTLVESMEAIRGILERKQRTRAVFHIRGHRVGDMGIITSRHGVLYQSEYGWDERFEALVGRIAADFIDHFDREKEKCFVAEQNGEVVGSAFVVRQSDEVAKLRLLYVEPKVRGTGLGTRLVRECIAFAKQAGYRTMILWTNSVLADARRIYQREGFSLTEQEPHHSFGRDLVGETWSLTLCE